MVRLEKIVRKKNDLKNSRFDFYGYRERKKNR